MGSLIQLYGTTGGIGSTGTFQLTSVWLLSPVQTITIPKGTVAKIWSKHVTGQPVTVNLLYSNDGTNFRVVESETLGTTGETSPNNKRKPIILPSVNGVEAFQLQWSQTSGYVSSVQFDVEFGEYDLEG